MLVLPHPVLLIPRSDPKQQRSAAELEATCFCIPRNADTVQLKRKSSFLGFLRVFVGGFCSGFLWRLFVCWFIAGTDESKFHKEISYLPQFLETNPNAGRFLSLRVFVTYTLSRCLFKKPTNYFRNSRKP